MRVEIVQELESGDAWLEIPWASPTDPRLRFIDLKKFPRMIGNLSECRAFPPLVRLLRKVHGSPSPLRTAKCDVWTTSRLTADERQDFNLRFKVGSYLDLFFARANFNSRLQAHLQLAKKLEAALHPCRVQAQLEMAVRRCLFHPKERWGYYLTIFIHAYGATRNQAKKEWSRAVDCLGDALPGIAATRGATVRKRVN